MSKYTEEQAEFIKGLGQSADDDMGDAIRQIGALLGHMVKCRDPQHQMVTANAVLTQVQHAVVHSARAATAHVALDDQPYDLAKIDEGIAEKKEALARIHLATLENFEPKGEAN